MKKTKKILALVILLMLITTIFSNVKAAGSFSVSASSSSLTIGQTATLTITTSSCAGQFSISSSNSNVVAISKSSAFIDGSEKITLTAKTAGTATITVTPVDVSDESYNKITSAKSVTITVKDNTTSTQPPTTTQPPATTAKSSDATLKSITIGSKTYSGSSLKNTITYTADAKVNSIKISAVKNNSKATVSGTGTKSLIAGQTNKFTINVTAEDGTKKAYNVNIIRLIEESTVPNVIEGDIPETENAKLMLSSLIIKDVELDPEFNSETYTYVANVQNMTQLEIDATANNPDAEINIEGATDLKQGDNIVKITVILGDEKVEYIIDVYNTIQDEIIGATEDENNSNDENKISTNPREIILIMLICVLALIAIRYIIVSYKLSKEFEDSDDDIIIDDEEDETFEVKNQNISTKTTKVGRHF